MNDFAANKTDASEIDLSATFLAQGIAAGVVAGVLLTAALIARANTWDNFLMIQYLPYSVAFGVILSSIIGGVMWVPARFFDADLNLRVRIPVCLMGGFTVGLLVINLLVNVPVWFPPWWQCGLILGLPTGTLVGSKIGLKQVFSFGTVSIRDGDRLLQVSSSSRLALLGTLPLRLSSLAFLVGLIFSLALAWEHLDLKSLSSLWWGFWFCYCIAAYVLSYRTPRIDFFIAGSVLLNLPVAILMIFFYLASSHPVWGSLMLSFAILCLLGIVLWATCVCSRIFAPLVIEPDPRFVREQVKHHMCLGERFEDWQLVLQRTM